MTTVLPHAPYINAVEVALTEAKLEPESADAHQDDLDGHPLLRGRILLTPETSGIPADRWPHGLLIVWEWHTGRDPEIKRGPSWAWSRATAGGWADAWQELPVPGWVAPEMLVATVAGLAHTGKPIPMGSLWHDHLRQPVETAIEQWAADEEDEL